MRRVRFLLSVILGLAATLAVSAAALADPIGTSFP